MDDNWIFIAMDGFEHLKKAAEDVDKAHGVRFDTHDEKLVHEMLGRYTTLQDESHAATQAVQHGLAFGYDTSKLSFSDLIQALTTGGLPTDKAPPTRFNACAECLTEGLDHAQLFVDELKNMIARIREAQGEKP